jgi:CubicO group peptidase (beta-lactamase class C family)
MAGYVARGDVPGLLTLVSRRGDVHVDAIGMKAVGGSDPMRRGTIFRIASMTKPITAATAMIMVEECHLRFDEPGNRLLPELYDCSVLKRLDGPLDDTVPAERPIRVRALLTLRMGLGYLMVPSSVYPHTPPPGHASATSSWCRGGPPWRPSVSRPVSDCRPCTPTRERRSISSSRIRRRPYGARRWTL